MYLTYNEGKSVVAERFIRTLKNKIFKYMTVVSKNVYFNVLDDIVDKYNNTFQKTIKMKSIDVTSDSYAEYNDDSNENRLEFKVGDQLKDIRKTGQKKVLWLVKLKMQFHGHTWLMIYMVNLLPEVFMKNNCKRLVKKSLTQKK